MSKISTSESNRDIPVYLGVWVNWSQGSITGLTLTTTLQQGGLLIAFLALFVTFVGSSFWSIISFVAHQSLSRQGPQDGMYHQRQAILRNSDTSAVALWRLSRLIWSWRKHASPTSMKPSMLPLIASLLTFCAFAVAGVFSSRVATSRGGEVLIVGDSCSGLDPTLFTDENLALVQTYLGSRVKSSAAYASSCYSDYQSPGGCRTFIRNRLPYTLTRNMEYPFPGKDRICRSPNSTIRLDSGYLDSHLDLGINSPSNTRFLYRTISECTPLQTEGFTQQKSNSSTTIFSLLYGGDWRTCLDYKNGCTYQFVDRAGQELHYRNEYSLDMRSRYALPDDVPNYGATSFEPIPELRLKSLDVTVAILRSHDMAYFTPVNDPWFAATQGPSERRALTGTTQIYTSDRPASVLACAQQYQFCNPSLPEPTRCTPFLGVFEAARTASSTLFDQTEDKAAFMWYSSAITNMASGITDFSIALGQQALLASESSSSFGQYSLPDNQWELEVEHWFKFTLADLQRAILDQATGPVFPYAKEVFSPPNATVQSLVCGKQKIRTDSYTSFSILGLVVIFSVGGMIISIAAFLPKIFGKLQRRRNPFSNLEWISNDTLQLQRLAHEAVGAGNWQGACDDYPKTSKADLLAELDIVDRKHPVLRQPKQGDFVPSDDADGYVVGIETGSLSGPISNTPEASEYLVRRTAV